MNASVLLIPGVLLCIESQANLTLRHIQLAQGMKFGLSNYNIIFSVKHVHTSVSLSCSSIHSMYKV